VRETDGVAAVDVAQVGQGAARGEENEACGERDRQRRAMVRG